jgi:light-regulated signal transduction histidine kinase (bacteriophytochrome)
MIFFYRKVCDFLFFNDNPYLSPPHPSYGREPLKGAWRASAQHRLPYRDENDTIQGVVITFTDISRTKFQKDELERYSIKLESSNKDLQDFAYAASHDLQAPLRHFIFLAEQLQEKLASHLGKEEKELFDKLAERAEYMKTLLQNLLEFSRVHSRATAPESVKCSEMLHDALTKLRYQIEETNTTINQSLLPTLHGDASQIARVFYILIENAIKFRSDQDPVVDISAEHSGNEWILRVSDNGTGIQTTSKEEHDRAFLIFQRLHSCEDLPGTGVGLAVAKRVIERHGGRIWFESVPKKGTDFYFSLPVGPADNADGAPSGSHAGLNGSGG